MNWQGLNTVRNRLVLLFFNKTGLWGQQLTPGTHAMFAGRVSRAKGQRQLAHPERTLPGAADLAKAADSAIEQIPAYPASKSVRCQPVSYSRRASQSS